MRTLWTLVTASVLLVGSAQAATPEITTYETDDLTLLYFAPPETYLVPHVARAFHNSLAFQREVFGWEPWEATTVLLKDFGDYGNAAARASPNNALLVDIAPISRSFETFPAGERMIALMNHELVHVVTMDQWTEQDAGWRRFFGGKVMPIAEHPETILYNYLTNPRVSVPRWYLEGSAVWMETWMSGGLGRANGAYDEMVFRSMVRDGAEFYDPLGLVSEGTAVDFQVGVNAYLYGTRFINYMSYEYSPEQVLAWLQRNEGSARYYATQFEQVFGLPLEEAWDEWIAWEHEFQNSMLTLVRQNPETPTRDIRDRALGSVSRSFMDPANGSLLGGFRYPGVVAHLGILDPGDGSIEHITDIKGPQLYRVTSLAFDADSRTAFYTTDNYAFRDIVALNVDTGEQRELLKDVRIGELVFNPDDRSLWGVRHLNGFATLVRMPHPYTEWNQIHTFPYGQVPFDMDISPDGTMLSSSVLEFDGDQFLRVFQIADLMAGEVTPVHEFNFGQAVPEGFVFSPDGRYLFGSSYYTGISNIFRYEVANGALEAVSNAETGFFRPVPQADGSLIVFRYTGQGFVPTRIDPVPLDDVSATSFLGTMVAERHQTVRDWTIGPPSDVDLESLAATEGMYVPVRELQLESIYPVIEGYRDTVALGMHANISDPIGLNNLQVTVSYSPDDALPSDERLHAEVAYRHLGFWARGRYNDADFYDLFGPTERSRKGYSLGLGYEHTLIYDKPRQMDLSTELVFYNDLDTLPGNQNVGTAFERLLHAEVGLSYTNTRRSLGSVDAEKGWRWDLTLSGDHVNGETIPKLYGGLDFGFALPLEHSSVWLRTSAGVADGARADPFANFFFGSFQNNWVDNRAPQRYREHFTFPGFDIDQVGGRSFSRAILEWNLPPVRFSRVGSPGFFASWARPALFASVLTMNPQSSAFRRSVQNLGVQVDVHFDVLHRLPMILSFGYAIGFEDGRQADEEFMLSLKIL